MAIKGKTRGRGAKGVTRGPKPAYVPVRQPLLRRSGLWISLGTLLVSALLVALGIGFLQQREDDRGRDEIRRMATVVNQYRGQVDPILSSIGRPVPPVSFDGFPELDGSLAALEAEEPERSAVRQAGRTARSVVSSARSAIGLVEEIPTGDLLRGHGFPQEFILSMVNSQGNFLRGLRLYREAALLASAASQADGRERTTFAARARGVLEVADEVLGRGYSEYVEAQSAAEIFDPFAGVEGATG